MRVILAAALVLTSLPAFAAAPDVSIRPVIRGAEQIVQAAVQRPKLRPGDMRISSRGAAMPQRLPGTLPEKLRPSLRPMSEQDLRAQDMGSALMLASAAISLPQSSRPLVRPKGLAEKVMGQRRKDQQAEKRGAVCGDLDIQGEAIGNVPGRIPGCGVSNAVRVRSIAGVALSQGAVMNCRTAQATKTWINKGVKPAIGNRGGGIATLQVAAHYACRTRNNKVGAKLSEHSKGNAIDISAFIMRDGSKITLSQGWRSPRDGPILKQMWRAACGPYGTVLGPNSDRYHQNHFHFDTAQYRSGSFCR